jgi:hypothetical protein
MIIIGEKINGPRKALAISQVDAGRGYLDANPGTSPEREPLVLSIGLLDWPRMVAFWRIGCTWILWWPRSALAMEMLIRSLHKKMLKLLSAVVLTTAQQ